MKIGELTGDKGRTTGHQAVDGVIDHELSASPQNYELWLHYQNDWTPGLRNEIESYISDTGHLDEQQTELLYDKYFNSSRFSAHVAQTGAKLASELTAALQALNQAGHRTEEFSGHLDDAAEELEQSSLSPDKILEIVSKLSSATQQMSEQNAELTKKLEESSSEISDLREHLQTIRTEALTDALTGVANRKQFDNMLRFRTHEARNLGYPLTLAICDIDHFKSFNDTWGHQTGDQVIRFVAATLERLALKDHLVARYGGEEFAIIMPRVTAEEACDILERMRKAIEVKKLKRKSTGDSLGNVTMSFGAAELTDEDSCSTLIRRSDEQLYAAKRAGRNQVSVELQKETRAA
ncbi:GGDEF domain-containing protein [Ponticaulis koreensis]|uniref:GGDEF domain-containing protein n=1 Tax=Ponticaulis koreensis TaxID=1123045 RepID=UPI0003B33605|nr:GGDEF domain-containing protein [Ponticaulis koreensis]